jgi:hypothetical protein
MCKLRWSELNTVGMLRGTYYHSSKIHFDNGNPSILENIRGRSLMWSGDRTREYQNQFRVLISIRKMGF